MWDLTEARRWLAAAPHPAAPWVVASAAGAAAAVSIVTSPSCAEGGCQPAPWAWVALGLLLASTLLLWLEPRVAAAAALALAVVGGADDGSGAGRVGWVCLGVLHLGHLAYRASCARRQRAIVRPFLVAVGPVALAGSRRSAPLLAGAAVAGIVALAATAIALHERAEVQRQVERSQPAMATVVADRGEDRYSLRLDSPPRGVPETIDLTTIDRHRVGERLALRVDPARPGAGYPADEPPDPYPWLALTTLGLTGCDALLWRADRPRRRGAALAAATHALPVRWVADGRQVGLCVGWASAVWAEMPVDEEPTSDLGPGVRPDRTDHEGERGWLPTVREGWLSGDVVSGGWGTVRGLGQGAAGAGVLRGVPLLPLAGPVADPAEAGLGEPAVTPAAPLPIVDRSPASARARWGAVLTGISLVAGAAAVWVDPGDWWSVLASAAGAGWLVWRAVDEIARGLRIDSAGITLTTPAVRRQVLVEEIRAVRLEEAAVVVVELDDEELVLDLGAASPGAARALQEMVGSGGALGDPAAPRSGGPGRSRRLRPSPGLLLLVPALVLVAVAAIRNLPWGG